MPQADLFHTADLAFDAAAALNTVEEVIRAKDPSSGLCKGRAFPITISKNDHVLLRLGVLQKAHRDDAFMMGLSESLLQALTPHCPKGTLLNVELSFLSPYYQSAQV